ncbi:MAG: porin [Gallionella sp.]|nr:porin [Gallionella sp.]
MNFLLKLHDSSCARYCNRDNPPLKYSTEDFHLVGQMMVIWLILQSRFLAVKFLGVLTKMMKKSLIAVAILGAFAGAAQAEDAGTARPDVVSLSPISQSELNVYGILDVGVAQMTNAGNFGSQFVTGANPTGSNSRIGTSRGMMNGGESQSRWGIKGSEDLGGGNKAFFRLESAFSLGTGSVSTSGLAGGANAAVGGINNRAMIADTALNGQLFNRMALVGLSNTDMGAVSFGRQYSLQLDIIASTNGYDPVNAQMFSPINFSGSYGGGGATDNSRVDNAIKYSKKIGNFNVNAMYGMGGMAGAPSARSNAQANVGYEGDAFGVQLAMQQANDTTNLSPNALPNTVTAQYVNLTSYLAALRYQATEQLALKAGYERMQISAPSNYGADQGIGQLYGYNVGSMSAFTGQKNINVFWLGANYQVSSAVKASVGFYDAQTPAYVGSGVGGAGQPAAGATGDDKYYSAMVEYYLSKKTNLYAAFMLDKKSGGLLVSATGPGSIATFNTYGAGLRVQF